MITADLHDHGDLVVDEAGDVVVVGVALAAGAAGAGAAGADEAGAGGGVDGAGASRGEASTRAKRGDPASHRLSTVTTAPPRRSARVNVTFTSVGPVGFARPDQPTAGSARQSTIRVGEQTRKITPAGSANDPARSVLPDVRRFPGGEPVGAEPPPVAGPPVPDEAVVPEPAPGVLVEELPAAPAGAPEVTPGAEP
jgi:hypothetical protein